MFMNIWIRSGIPCVCLFITYSMAKEDVRYKRISLFKLLVFLIIGLIQMVCSYKNGLFFAVMSLIPGILFLIVSIMTKEKLGFGDALCVLGLGMCMGYRFAMFSVELGLLLAFLWGVIFQIRKQKYEDIPYIPFLLSGMVISFGVIEI